MGSRHGGSRAGSCHRFFYFHVSGKEIASLAAIDEDCEVVIVRHDLLDEASNQEYTLAEPQIEELKELLLKSSFTRRLGFLNEFSRDSVFYSIYVNFDDEREYLFFNCVGGDFISVYSSFEEKDYNLKINGKDWKASLENILKAAQTESA